MIFLPPPYLFPTINTSTLRTTNQPPDGAALDSMDSPVITTTHAHHAFPTQDNPANAYIIYQTFVFLTVPSETKYINLWRHRDVTGHFVPMSYYQQCRSRRHLHSRIQRDLA